MKYHLELDVDLRRNPYKGVFVVLEGIDGAGKTTQVEDLVEILSNKYKVFKTKNPTDNPIGKFIREGLKGRIDIPPVSFQYLFTADREAQQLEVIKHLKKGEIVVMDRYIWSTIAYGLLDHGFRKMEKTGNVLLVALSILSMYHQFLTPDLMIYLDVSVPTAIERLKQIGRFDTETFKRRNKIIKAKISYEWLVKKFPKEIIVINGEKNESEITQEILSYIEPLLKK